MRKHKGKIIVGLVLAGLVMIASVAPTERYFDIAKSLDIYATLFKEVNTYYVDEIKPEELIRKSIDGMLESLDPYTNFIPQSEVEEFRISTTGQYAGIGALIGVVNKKIVITYPYEGFPAQKAGLKVGDEIISIDGKDLRGKNTGDVSTLLKGQAGTTMEMKINRPGQNGTQTLQVKRENIHINNVTFSGMITPSIGYITLEDFTNDAGKEVGLAVKTLKDRGAKQIILDLRDNPGGLLHEAVNIANVFIPKNKEVVSTRGKVKDWNKTYSTLNNPVDTAIPLVVLVNGNSASASEIVAGSLQDYDRAVLIGQRTFGKGLVQTTRHLAYDAELKVTTAKYFIPSGRCIQELDYSHRNADGTVDKFADSARHEFKTANGRIMFDGGGLEPDVPVKVQYTGAVARELVNSGNLFEYAALYANQKPEPASLKDFKFTDKDYTQFISWLATKNFRYEVPVEIAAEELTIVAKEENYYKELQDNLNALKSKIKANKTEDLTRFKSEIELLLERQIAFDYNLSQGRVDSSLDDDDEIREAIRILSNPSQYNAILIGQR